MSVVDVQGFRQLLEEQRKQVLEAIEALHREHPGSLTDDTQELTAFDNHLADSASATLDREIDYTLEENEEELLRQIDGALERIDEGTYGICRKCGREIGEDRLRALPWATLCIDDKRKEERG